MPTIISGRGMSLGGSVIGGSVTINGKRIVAGDDVIIVGGALEDLPKVHEEYEGVKRLVVDDSSQVSFQVGEKFVADGTGYCHQSGECVALSSFTGTVTCPPLQGADLTLNSGSLHGQLSSVALDVKVNSGSLNLRLSSSSKSPTINAKVNSGSVNITVQ